MSLDLAQGPVDELNAHRALAHRRRDALHAARPHVSDREDARPDRLQQIGSTGQRPSRLLEVIREEVGSGLDEVLVVERQASLEPGGVRVGAGHQEQVTDRARLRFPGVELAPSDPLETVGASSASICVRARSTTFELSSIRWMRYRDMLSARPGPRTS